jgi:GDP-L-fucose synthase
VRRLREERADVLAPTSRECDLRDPANAHRLLGEAPDCVFHLAARVGGIGANREHPATFFHDTLAIGLNVLHAAQEGRAKMLVQVGTVCSYPKHTPVPFREEDLWSGFPEETNAAYGVAKRALITGSMAYAAEFGLRSANVLLLNLYGEGDDFDPETSHVIPALIRKCVEAVETDAEEVVVWGDGTATLLLAALRSQSPEPVNLGAPGEVSIREIAETIARLAGFRGTLRFDPSKPNGQPRRALDCTRAAQRFGFRAHTTMDVGLARTLAWFRADRERRRLFPTAETLASSSGS